MPNGLETNTMQQALITHVASAVSSARKTTWQQLLVSVILMLAGAAIGVISVELKDTAVAAGFGTALIGAGATLLPAGASASTNSDLHSALAQLAILAGAPQTPPPAPPTAPPPVGQAPAPRAVIEPTPTAAAAEEPSGGNGAVRDAAVRSAIEADAADAAALAAERPA